ncbi:MAG: hypothetical protein MRY57_01625 [Candidatus Pacebacteria bacterium]|nr:hypothetical protein [Candidatus Paceibacterota bacterium]
MKKIFISIIKQPKNIFAIIIGSGVILSIFKLLPNIHIVRDFWQLKGVSFARKIEILYDYSFGEYSLWYVFDSVFLLLLCISIMINVLVFIYYIKRQKKALNKGSFLATTGGIVLATFGVGCISCGAIVLAPLLTSLGLLGFLQILPFFGKEFLVLGIIIIWTSTFYLLKQMNKPLVC